MITNILDYLEKTAERVPEKTAFSGENGSLSFKELLNRSQRLGSYLQTAGYYKKPVVIFMEDIMIGSLVNMKLDPLA